MLTHQTIARQKALRWQIGALAIAAAAAGAMLLPLNKLLSPKLIIAGTVGGGPEQLPTPPAKVINPHELGRVLESVSARVPASPVDKPTTQLEPHDKPIEVASGEWQYVGSIITPTSRHALIKIDADQHLIMEGAKEKNRTILAVEESYIKVQDGISGPVQTLQLVKRTLDAPGEGPKRPVAFRTPPAPGTPGAPNPPGVVNNVANVAAERARQQEQARAQAEAARRGAQPPQLPPLDPTTTTALVQRLADASASPEERLQVLHDLGISPGTPAVTAIDRLKAYGVDFDDTQYQGTFNDVNRNAAMPAAPTNFAPTSAPNRPTSTSKRPIPVNKDVKR